MGDRVDETLVSGEPDFEISYKDAKAELDMLVAKLESSDVGIDELRELVERARFLVQTCRQRIRRVEGEIEILLSDEMM